MKRALIVWRRTGKEHGEDEFPFPELKEAMEADAEYQALPDS